MERETQKSKIASILASLDLEEIADELLMYGVANTGGELIELPDKVSEEKIHICYLNSSDDEDFSHFYCYKDDFIDIIKIIGIIIEKDDPEYIDAYNKSADIIRNRLEDI